MTNLFKASFGQVSALVSKLAHAGFTAEMAKAVAKSPSLATVIVEAIKHEQEVAQKQTYAQGHLFPVSYDTPSLEELERRFAAVHPFLGISGFTRIESCKNVPFDGSRNLAFEVLSYEKSTKTSEVLADLDRKGLRSAVYEELVCFDEFAPKPRKFITVALGSILMYIKEDYVACTRHGGATGRKLDLADCNEVWETHYEFLAVRK